MPDGWNTGCAGLKANLAKWLQLMMLGDPFKRQTSNIPTSEKLTLVLGLPHPVYLISSY